MLTVCALMCLQPAADQPARPLVPYPHPLITEVLYAVPTRDGDANGDGARHANGDEFIELINPHDRPIQLRGYELSGKEPRIQRDGQRDRSFTQLKFTFPALELKPGEVVVVFNGYDQSWKGPVGDDSRAPAGRNEHFDNAWVFTMRAATSKVGLVNGGDRVLLCDPELEPVHCLTWGEVVAPGNVPLLEAAPSSRGSVSRLSATGPFQPHPVTSGRPYSPGQFPPAQAPSSEPRAPEADSPAR